MDIEKRNLGKYILADGSLYIPGQNKILKRNIIVKDGILKDINYKGSYDGFKIIDCKGKIISPGLFDLRAQFGEPGNEDRETLESGSKAALFGGFTKVCILPNTDPVLDTPELIDTINNK